MAANIRIIIGDDERPMRASFRRNARIQGYEVHEASTGEELVEKVKQANAMGQSYSLIITDNEYGPSITGIEAIKKIRDFDIATPILWNSGRVNGALGKNDKNVAAALEAGATQAIAKNPQTFSDIFNEYKSRWEQK